MNLIPLLLLSPFFGITLVALYVAAILAYNVKEVRVIIPAPAKQNMKSEKRSGAG